MRPARSAALSLLCCCAIAASAQAAAPESGKADAPDAIEQEGTASAHDPTVIRYGDRYYRFSTGAGIPLAYSKDLRTWFSLGKVFQRSPEWTRVSVPGSSDFWAPEIVKMGSRYRMYYSVSTFGSNVSAIGMASNATLDPYAPDYEWVDEGAVIESRRGDDFNAIDPAVAFDAGGVPWMAFGSFWSGIKLARLDPETGKLAEPSAPPLSIARRPDSVDAIEGAYILPKDGEFFLFVSFDACCRGVNSSYNIRVGRAASIAGPYLDREGNSMLEGGGTLVREGGERYKGPGHNSILVDEGTYYLVYHAYDAKYSGQARCRIEALRWDERGWPYVTGVGAGAR